MVTSNATDVSLVIQPSLLFRLVKSFKRRNLECPNRVIGVILGTRDQHDHIYEAVHSFSVRHIEDGVEVAIDLEQLAAYLEIHKQVHGKRSVLLGWYSMQVEGANFWPSEAEIESVSGQPTSSDKIFRANNLFLNEIFARQVKDSTTGSWSTSPPCVFLQVQVSKSGKFQIESFINGHQDEDGIYQLRSISHHVHSHDSAEASTISALQEIILNGIEHSERMPNNTISIPIRAISESLRNINSRFQTEISRMSAIRSENASAQVEINKKTVLLPDSYLLKKMNENISSESSKMVAILEKKLNQLQSHLQNSEQIRESS